MWIVMATIVAIEAEHSQDNGCPLGPCSDVLSAKEGSTRSPVSAIEL
jgi:hypothetical protein